MFDGEKHEIALKKGKTQQMVIKYKSGFTTTKVFLMAFKGNFIVYINKTGKPDKEKHDLMFSIEKFTIDYHHNLDQIEEVFLSVFALTDLQAVIKIEKKLQLEESIENTNEEFKKRNCSLPAILNGIKGDMPGSSFDTNNNSKEMKTERNYSRNKVFFKKIDKKHGETERKLLKANFKREQKEIQTLFEKKINLLKSLQKKEENFKKKTEFSYQIAKKILQANWILLIVLLNATQNIKKVFSRQINSRIPEITNIKS